MRFLPSLLLLLGTLAVPAALRAQQADGPEAPAEVPVQVVLKITPRIIETDQTVSWEQPLTKTTQPGVPVVVNIGADSLTIRITVTPYVQGKGFLLVVQGNVRQTGDRGTRQSSSLQSLLVPPGEPIAYFPLGRAPGGPERQMVVLIRAEFPGE